MKNQVLFCSHPSYDEDLFLTIEKILDHFEEILPKGGKRVLLKPNLVMAMPRKRAGLTDPHFIEAIVLAGKKRAWEMTLGDSPAFGSAHSICQKVGIGDVLKRHQIPIIQLTGSERYRSNDKALTVSSSLKSFDAIINLPKVKAHQQLYFSGAVKNLFGCVSGKRKVWRHMTMGDNGGFEEMLLSNAQKIKPCLSLIDGIHGMQGNGPIHGDGVQLGFIAASTDPVNLDYAVIKLLKGDPLQDPIQNLANINPPEVQWLGNPLLNIPFDFPSERQAIRFNPLRVLKSVGKNLISLLVQKKS